jgi:hypothetical protein
VDGVGRGALAGVVGVSFRRGDRHVAETVVELLGQLLLRGHINLRFAASGIRSTPMPTRLLDGVTLTGRGGTSPLRPHHPVTAVPFRAAVAVKGSGVDYVPMTATNIATNEDLATVLFVVGDRLHRCKRLPRLLRAIAPAVICAVVGLACVVIAL